MKPGSLRTLGASIPGKLSGLRGVTDASGRFKVLALDQSNSFRKFIKAAMERVGKKGEATYDQVVHAKMEITEVLAPYASAVLLDVNYGARQGINSFSVPRGVGLIVRVIRFILTTLPRHCSSTSRSISPCSP